MSLEQAVRRLTFESASTFGIYDRGLLRPGLAADITIFDPETVNPLPEDTVHDFPAGSWRVRELAQGIQYTIVNGQVLLETGAIRGPSPDASSGIPSTRAVPQSNGRRPRVPLSPTRERGVCWSGNSGARWPGMGPGITATAIGDTCARALVR